MIICEANLGRGRIKGELIQKNEKTVIMRPISTTSQRLLPGVKQKKYVKRHIEKHNVSFIEPGKP